MADDRIGTGPLSQQEKALLRSLGASETSPEKQRKNQAVLEQRWKDLAEGVLDNAYDLDDVCKLLDVSEYKLQAMIENREILTHNHVGNIRFPRFQFYDGKLLPHWGKILKSIRPEVSVFEIYRFTTTKSADFAFGKNLGSPSDWLSSNGSSKLVEATARDL